MTWGSRAGRCVRCFLSHGVRGVCLSISASMFTLAWAGSGSFTLEANIVGSTCTVGGDPTLDLGRLSTSTAVGSNWSAMGQSKFDLTLSACGNVGEAGKTPAITFDATPLMVGGVAVSAHELFKTSGSSEGFGVMVLRDNNGKPGGGLCALNSTGGASGCRYIDVAAQGDAATNKKVPLWVTVTCGPSANCTAAKLKPGSLLATLTFAFTYH